MSGEDSNVNGQAKQSKPATSPIPKGDDRQDDVLYSKPPTEAISPAIQTKTKDSYDQCSMIKFGKAYDEAITSHCNNNKVSSKRTF